MTCSFITSNCSLSNETNLNDTIKYPNVTYTPYHERPETYIVPILFALIFMVGVLGNGTLILIFLRNRNMRNVPNTYIFSLALGDLLVIITCVPFTSTVYTFDSWPYGELICTMSESVKDISIGVSVFTLTALSGDRFFAIVDPMKKLHTSVEGKRTTRLTIMIVLMIWLVAILCATPAISFTHLKRIDVNPDTVIFVCYPFPDEFAPMYGKTMVIAKFVIYYAIPLSIIAYFYIRMARHLVLSTVNMPGVIQGQAKQIQARKKVAKMVLAFVVIFAICFLPQHIFMIWFYNNPTAQEDYNAFWNSFRIIGFCLGFVNSCINPIALYCVSGAFRKHFKRYLLCRPASNQFRSNTTGRSQLTPSSSSRRDYPLCSWNSMSVNNLSNSARRHHTMLHQHEDTTVTTLITSSA